MQVITRFAPSPTGYLHIGGARTALFNWLFARHHGGQFLLRVEDTDRARSTPAATQAILDGMNWLGLHHDGEVVYQLAGAERHAQVAHEMVLQGRAFHCYTTAEELEAFRTEHPNAKFRSPYRNSLTTLDKPSVIRLRAPLEGETTVEDHVQGSVTIQNSEMDDMVLLRSDGTPTYMLAVVVDDHDMGITHVIRGDDHFTNAFRQTLLYQALGWRVPEFAHIPLIHGADGAKLSKRHGALGVDAYREMGFLPEAVRNYLLRLGWSHGDNEIITTQQAVEWFNLDSIGKSPSRFDMAKLESVNGHYIKEADDARLIDLLKDASQNMSDMLLKRAIPILKQRAKTLLELRQALQPYVECPKPDDAATALLASGGRALLEKILPLLQSLPDWEAATLDAAIKMFVTEENLKFPAIGQPLRIALTGTAQGISVPQIMEILGRDESLERIGAVC